MTLPRYKLKSDPMANDPGRWGHSLGNLAEIWLAVLDAAGARSVVEVGAYAGDTTRILLDWASDSGARIVAIDPEPQASLEQLADANPALHLIRATSLDTLPTITTPEAVIVDGDHNYYTVSQELRLIDEHSRQLPLIICHDAGWPHGRRDAYYAIEQIPSSYRQPSVDGGRLFPGQPGIHRGGLQFYHHRVAEREGGARNGVLTAIEDFVQAHGGLELAIVPAFFGLAVVWPRTAAWAEEVAAVLAPYRDHPVLARLEANRVLNLARWETERARTEGPHDPEWLNAHWNAGADLLGRLLASRTFTVAVWLSRLYRRGAPAVSKDEIRRVLEN